MARGSGVIARYRERLPLPTSAPVVTLGEGETPLIRSKRLSARFEADVWLKCEGANPTGSFKDRGMTVALSGALAEGAGGVACASTGNTSASAAAYAARAGLPCAVLVPRGGVALGKLAQALAHGARVLEIDAGFDTALGLVSELAAAGRLTLVNSLNPLRIEGQKTAAFEIAEQLGRAPDLHLMPVGNAGNITAHWRGYREARNLGWCSALPRMFGFQAEGAAPIVRGAVVERPETIAGAIRIGRPASWAEALDATASSGGAVLAVSDEQIAAAYRALAEEGVFVEPASAAPVAGLGELARRDLVPRGCTVVCVLTGHGLKDPDWALGAAPRPVRVPAEAAAVVEALGLG